MTGECSPSRAPHNAPRAAQQTASQRLGAWAFVMQRLSSRWFLGNAGVIAAAALFLLTAIILGFSVEHMLDNAAKTEQAQSILREASNLQDGMIRASATARSYLLSHDQTMLRDRNNAIGAVKQSLNALNTYMDGDPAGDALLFRTRRNIERRIALYDHLINGTSGPALDTSDAERLRLARINDAQITELRQRADERFRYFQKRVTEGMRLSMILALITGIASPLFGAIGVRLLRQQRDSQQARELRLELIHVQRLAIMGETSAMLAHEINQPLTAAGNYIAVAQRLLSNDGADKAAAVLDRIDEQIKRAAAIIRKLRRFIEKREAERCLESPDTLVEDAITLLGTIDGSITLETEIAPGLPLVFVDRVQIQQVLVNLMRNAIEAMQDREKRSLKLSIRHDGGKTLEVALADSGPGLHPDVAARMFRPFVSTKANGMGVGLSICHSIIAQHGGRIWVEPNPSGGTIFRFTLQVAAARNTA